MKTKIIILGAVFAAFLMLMMPSISAVKVQTSDNIELEKLKLATLDDPEANPLNPFQIIKLIITCIINAIAGWQLGKWIGNFMQRVADRTGDDDFAGLRGAIRFIICMVIAFFVSIFEALWIVQPN